jgi:hypothetical protein
MDTWLPGGALFGSIEARADRASSETTSFAIASAEAGAHLAESDGLFSIFGGALTASCFETRGSLSGVEVLPQPANEIDSATAQH